MLLRPQGLLSRRLSWLKSRQGAHLTPAFSAHRIRSSFYHAASASASPRLQALFLSGGSLAGSASQPTSSVCTARACEASCSTPGA